jgi:DNA processing protein
MGEGAHLETLLSLVLSGAVPGKKAVSFLRGVYRECMTGTGMADSCEMLRLGPDGRQAMEKARPLARQVLDRVAALGARTITFADSAYPPLLRETPVPPPVLFHKGSLDDMSAGAVAIVGSRRATLGGRKLAWHLARELAQRGLTVVSGLARGIDTSAHRGALEAGGPTIAVLGCGLDVVYPPENKNLAARIESSGALLTEFVPGTPPLRQNFPMRNRIISGLSLGTVVVEAAENSGALITAGFALEHNRSVFAVPGAPGIRGSRGTNSLLRQGARLVESVEDILDEIEPQIAWRERSRTGSSETGPPGPCGSDLSPDEQAAMELLSDMPAHVDEISRTLGIEPGLTLGLMLTLEARGLARSMPGKFYVKETLL